MSQERILEFLKGRDRYIFYTSAFISRKLSSIPSITNKSLAKLVKHSDIEMVCIVDTTPKNNSRVVYAYRIKAKR